MAAVLDRRWPRALVPLQARLIIERFYWRRDDPSGLWAGFLLVGAATLLALLIGVRR